MNMVKRTWAEISLNAIEHNYNVIRNKVADDTKVCCVIKADGYGHGAGIVIEKAYQGGGNLVRDMGIRVESLAQIICGCSACL